MTPEKSQVETQAAESCLQAQPGSLEQLRAFAEGGYLFAILDATDCPSVPVKAQELGKDRAVSLFRGTAEENYWEVAPYLMKIDPELLEWIKQSRWSEPWGIFATAKCGLDELRRHLRRFLLVKLSNGKTWYFRYYDPRVLKPFLEACHTDELVRIFGPVRGFATGAESKRDRNAFAECVREKTEACASGYFG